MTFTAEQRALAEEAEAKDLAELETKIEARVRHLAARQGRETITEEAANRDPVLRDLALLLAIAKRVTGQLEEGGYVPFRGPGGDVRWRHAEDMPANT